MERPFTHIDDLRQTDPEYFIPNTSDIMAEKYDAHPKTPVMLLDEGLKRLQGGEAAVYAFSGGTLQVPDFTAECTFRDIVGRGTAKSKKIAKQYAARELLKQLIRNFPSYCQYFNFPADVEEAIAVIERSTDQLNERPPSPPAAEDAEFIKEKNYVGAVQEFCTKSKLQMPRYEDIEEGPPTDRTFIVKCFVQDVQTEGTGKKKKDAKTLAAFLMLTNLEKGMKIMDKDFNDLVIDETEIDEPVRYRPCTINPGKSMEEILNDKDKVASFTAPVYRTLEKPCTFGMTQVMMTIVCAKKGEHEEEYVFCGAGNDEEAAKRSAKLNALLLLETF